MLPPRKRQRAGGRAASPACDQALHSNGKRRERMRSPQPGHPPIPLPRRCARRPLDRRSGRGMAVFDRTRDKFRIEDPIGPERLDTSGHPERCEWGEETAGEQTQMPSTRKNGNSGPCFRLTASASMMGRPERHL